MTVMDDHQKIYYNYSDKNLIKLELEELHNELSGIVSAARSYQSDRQNNYAALRRELSEIDRELEHQYRNPPNRLLSKLPYTDAKRRRKTTKRMETQWERVNALAQIVREERLRYAAIMEAGHWVGLRGY